MIIETKFNIGDELHHVFSKRVMTCTICCACEDNPPPEGYICATCHGCRTMMVEAPDVWAHECMGRIEGVRVTIASTGRTQYSCDEDCWLEAYSEHDLFRSESDAQAECDHRNSSEGGVNHE